MVQIIYFVLKTQINNSTNVSTSDWKAYGIIKWTHRISYDYLN